MGYIQNNIGTSAQIKAVSGGFEQQAPASAFVVKGKGFAGVLDLTTPFGTLWNDYAQTGTLAITVGGYSEVGGIDLVKITSNGSAITVPANFTNIGTDSISSLNGAINIFMIVKATETTFYYIVKVI